MEPLQIDWYCKVGRSDIIVYKIPEDGHFTVEIDDVGWACIRVPIADMERLFTELRGYFES